MMMERSRHPIDVVADQTGFADRNRMRRAFLRAFGQPPQVLRRQARQAIDYHGASEPTPHEGAQELPDAIAEVTETSELGAI